MFAASDVHQHGPSWHHRKRTSAEDALCFPCQRQQADGDIGLIEKRLKLVAAMENGNLCGPPRRANPRRDLEAERLQHQRRRFGHHSEAQKTDAPVLGPDDRCPAPFSIDLSRMISRHVAMETQNVHDDIFSHHWITAWRFHFTKWDLRQFWMFDKGLHSGRTAEHGFQIREYGKQVEIWVEEFNVVDVP